MLRGWSLYDGCTDAESWRVGREAEKVEWIVTLIVWFFQRVGEVFTRGRDTGEDKVQVTRNGHKDLEGNERSNDEFWFHSALCREAISHYRTQLKNNWLHLQHLLGWLWKMVGVKNTKIQTSLRYIYIYKIWLMLGFECICAT